MIITSRKTTSDGHVERMVDIRIFLNFIEKHNERDHHLEDNIKINHN